MKRAFIYEKGNQPVASKKVFSQRLLRNGLLALTTIFVALAIGMAGYMGFESMGFIDAFANAAMILSGMGPLTPLLTDGGKIFAGFYALFSGLLIFGVAGLILAPVLHRILHSFHVDDNGPKN
jgi:hypothetical protein